MVSVDMTEQATDYVRRMYENEYKGWGDSRNALKRLEIKTSVSFWALDHLRRGKARTIESGLYHQIKAAYFRMCESQIQAFEEEITSERVKNGDDSLEFIEDSIAALARKIEAKVAQLKFVRKR